MRGHQSNTRWDAATPKVSICYNSTRTARKDCSMTSLYRYRGRGTRYDVRVRRLGAPEVVEAHHVPRGTCINTQPCGVLMRPAAFRFPARYLLGRLRRAPIDKVCTSNGLDPKEKAAERFSWQFSLASAPIEYVSSQHQPASPSPVRRVGTPSPDQGAHIQTLKIVTWRPRSCMSSLVVTGRPRHIPNVMSRNMSLYIHILALSFVFLLKSHNIPALYTHFPEPHPP